MALGTGEGQPPNRWSNLFHDIQDSRAHDCYTNRKVDVISRIVPRRNRTTLKRDLLSAFPAEERAQSEVTVNVTRSYTTCYDLTRCPAITLSAPGSGIPWTSADPPFPVPRSVVP